MFNIKNMVVYNSLSGKKEELSTLVEGLVKMYVCGVTVYGPLHLGHVRTFVAYDIIRKYLEEFKEHKVLFIQNITDVGHIVGDIDDGEDKIQKAANILQKHPMEIVDENIKVMWDGLDKLKCKRPNISPRATGHIVEIIDAIQKLIDNGYAYISDGDVYYDVSKFKNYGKLSGNTLNNLLSGARVETNEKKKSYLDFALWKKSENGHIMEWSSPWSVGYPGWHIECSVMGIKYLGDKFDIHGGARELKFPHHENEIAQCEAMTGDKVVNYWLHTGVLNINGQKMAKSTGNYISIDDMLKKYTAETLRFFVALSHYSATIDVTDETLLSAENGLRRINNFILNLEKMENGDSVNDISKYIEEFEESFVCAMDDDFNTPNAIASMYEFIRKMNKLEIKEISSKDKKRILEIFYKINKVFDIFTEKKESDELGEDITKLIELRVIARQEKDWSKADSIKQEIISKGYSIFDKPDGSTEALKIKK